MNLELWKTVWTVAFIISLVLFAGLAVWVTIVGFSDIKRLLRRIDDTRQDDG